MKEFSNTQHCPGMIFRLAALAFILLLSAPAARGQHVTFRGGASTMLYDEKYFPGLYGEGISPVFPSFGARLGWQDLSGSPVAAFCNNPELGVGLQVDALAAFRSTQSPGRAITPRFLNPVRAVSSLWIDRAISAAVDGIR